MQISPEIRINSTQSDYKHIKLRKGCSHLRMDDFQKWNLVRLERDYYMSPAYVDVISIWLLTCCLDPCTAHLENIRGANSIASWHATSHLLGNLVPALAGHLPIILRLRLEYTFPGRWYKMSISAQDTFTL
jgi:hypothetical protein